MKKIICLAFNAMLIATCVTAQSVGINNEGLAPHPSAMLDIRSLGKGLLIPRMSEDDRVTIVSPATGLMVYQTTGNTGFWFFEGTWKKFGDNLGDHTATQTVVLGNNRIAQTDNGTGLAVDNRGAVTIRQKAITNIAADSAVKENITFGSDGSILARGKYLTGPIPMTGTGMRLMWWPTRGAFRAGNALNTEWDSLNIKDYSFAFGNQVIANAYGAVAFGDQVNVTSTVGTGFGSAIRVSGTAGFAAGASNTAGGFCSNATGYTDSAMGQGTVALGYRMLAREDYSVAIGYRGRAIHSGSLVLSDASSLSATLSTYTTSSAANQMTARYSGGFRFFTNDDMNIGVSLTASDNSWNIISDSNRKEKFLPADGEKMLGSIRKMRLGSWNYKGKQQTGMRHYGPMAQEFYNAFGKDEHGTIGNDTTINQANLEGVLMIMIKALEERTAKQADEISLLKTQNETLAAQIIANKKIQEEWAALLKSLEKNDNLRTTMKQRADLKKGIASNK